jgi:hypothetical protein
MPLPGVELYTRRGGSWYRLGASLPAPRLPVADGSQGVPLERILLPRPMTPAWPSAGSSPEPAWLRLVRDQRGRNRPATALLCPIEPLADWAEGATSARLAALRAAWTAGAGRGTSSGRVLVLGASGSLPELADGLRFWGLELLVPLGFRPEPDLPEPALRQAIGAGSSELILLDGEGVERIRRDAIQPLSRAGIRLASKAMAPGVAEGGLRV